MEATRANTEQKSQQVPMPCRHNEGQESSSPRAVHLENLEDSQPRERGTLAPGGGQSAQGARDPPLGRGGNQPVGDR